MVLKEVTVSPRLRKDGDGGAIEGPLGWGLMLSRLVLPPARHPPKTSPRSAPCGPGDCCGTGLNASALLVAPTEARSSDVLLLVFRLVAWGSSEVLVLLGALLTAPGLRIDRVVALG